MWVDLLTQTIWRFIGADLLWKGVRSEGGVLESVLGGKKVPCVYTFENAVNLFLKAKKSHSRSII